MKLRKNTDLVVFLEKIRDCSGEVWFETPEGDKLNLKSKLSQYLFVALVGNEALLEQGYIKCDDASDYALLDGYLQ